MLRAFFGARFLPCDRKPSMTLSELLESKFRGDIRFRGAAYIQAERVSVIRVTPDHLFAVVRDGVEFQTQLTRDGAGLAMTCNCVGTSANPSNNLNCKHLWATILAADSGRYITGSAKPGYIPPFAVEDDEPLEFDLDDLEVDADEYFSKSPRPMKLRSVDREPRTNDIPTPRLREWESRLSDLRKAMQFDETSALTGGPRTASLLRNRCPGQ
jgi:hypothetical protein